MAHMRSVSESAHQQQRRTFSPGPPAAATGAVRPPPEGWYGPSLSARDRAPMPEFRRLHSSGNSPGRSKPLARVPEAFRPVDASFNRPVEPVGPPAPNRPPTSPPSLPTAVEHFFFFLVILKISRITNPTSRSAKFIRASRIPAVFIPFTFYSMEGRE